MGKNTRYDELTNRIQRSFSRSKTFEVDLSPGENTTLFDLSDVDRIGNDSFLESGPFNHVRVIPEAGSATVYVRKNREAFVSVATEDVSANDLTGQRYIGYLRIEGDDTNGFTGQIQVSTAVDSVEFDLLKMSGLLNVDN